MTNTSKDIRLDLRFSAGAVPGVAIYSSANWIYQVLLYIYH